MLGGDWKAMFKAVQTRDYDLAAYYLKMGIDPNYQHPEFMAAALVESVRFNHMAIAKLLLENGADPLIKEVLGGDTPMDVAKAKQNDEAMSLLKLYIDKVK